MSNQAKLAPKQLNFEKLSDAGGFEIKSCRRGQKTIRDAASVYFHIPFCKKKCDYCHFFVLPDKEVFHKQLLEALKLEWEMRKPLLAGKEILSLYFGGGTPALFGPEAIGTLIDWVQPKGAEVTLEANPENVTLDLMRAYRSVGINRVSIGVQSLHDPLLATLSRRHSAEEAIRAVEATRKAGIENISIDLMYDLPHQTLESWRETVKKAASLPITHLSLYNLTIEPHTVFFKTKPEQPDPEISKEMYLSAVDLLEEAGLKQYEISAFGLPSIHNSGYWKARPFLGFGPSAFSDWNKSRFRNVAHLNRYHKKLLAGEDPVDFSETLDPEARRREELAIGLRLLEGVPITPAAQDLIDEGLLEITGERLKLTSHGRLFYDTVAERLI